MSDGQDNQWREQEILKVAAALQDKVLSAAVVEYGYYCNRRLMSQIAEQIGGSLMFSEDFKRYDPLFETAMRKRVTGGKKVEVVLDGNPVHGLVFAVGNGEIVTFAAHDVGVMSRTVMVPEGTQQIYFLSKTQIGTTSTGDLTALYAALYLLVQRMLANDVFAVLKKLGDVKMIKQFTNCFGKQAYSDFQELVLGAVFDPTQRLVEGCDPDLVPREDAFTTLDLLAELAANDGNLFYPQNPLFEYKRIGRKRVQSAGVLTESEQKEIQDLTAKAKTPKQLAAVQARMAEIQASKPAELVFTALSKDTGCPVSKLVMNESRPTCPLWSASRAWST
jgi:hypothetical protein